MLDKKRILIVSSFIVGIIIIIIGAYFVINNGREVKLVEYTPEEEISDEQLRQTEVSLYFKGESGLEKEERLIDVKTLIDNPYEKILSMLIEGPKSEKLKNIIPNGTKINKIEKTGETLIINLSKEFKQNEEEEKISTEAIRKTLTGLTEINEIKIIVDD